MAASEPKVSIVIPNRDGATPRNGLTFLEMVMGTLAEQSFRDFEVIVVDNGSTDDSVAYLREHWPAVKVVELGENQGFPAAVNRGIAAARARTSPCSTRTSSCHRTGSSCWSRNSTGIRASASPRARSCGTTIAI